MYEWNIIWDIINGLVIEKSIIHQFQLNPVNSNCQRTDEIVWVTGVFMKVQSWTGQQIWSIYPSFELVAPVIQVQLYMYLYMSHWHEMLCRPGSFTTSGKPFIVTRIFIPRKRRNEASFPWKVINRNAAVTTVTIYKIYNFLSQVFAMST